MNKMIGSEFFLDRYEPLEDKEIKLDFLDLNIKDSVFISSIRNAVSLILDQNRFSDEAKLVLLPSFTSSIIVDQFLKGGYKVFYHVINKDLTFNRKLFLEDIERIRPSVVLIHGYFGFDSLDNIKDLIKNIRSSGVLVIEDMTQSLYSKIEHSHADYYIFDFKLWTALPDGAGLISSQKSFSFKPFALDISLEEKRLEAMHTKYLYINGDIDVKKEFVNLFCEAENLLLNHKNIYAMSPRSILIQANLDINFLRDARRANYKTLYRALVDSELVEPIFGELEEGVVPLCFPLYAKCNRDQLKNYLEARCIYLPILWPRPSSFEDKGDKTSQWIYENILTIPCDQRYIDRDMDRIVKVIKDYETSATSDKL